MKFYDRVKHLPAKDRARIELYWGAALPDEALIDIDDEARPFWIRIEADLRQLTLDSAQRYHLNQHILKGL